MTVAETIVKELGLTSSWRMRDEIFVHDEKVVKVLERVIAQRDDYIRYAEKMDHLNVKSASVLIAEYNDELMEAASYKPLQRSASQNSVSE